MHTCQHDATEMDVAAQTDGLCPLCLAAENARLRDALRWVLGEAPDVEGRWFGDQRTKDAPIYWWRTPLREIAGLNRDEERLKSST